MPDLLPLTGAAIADYQEHLGQYPDTDLAILAYLTRHINGLMCAEIEQVITRLVRERLESGCKDEATANFLKSMPRRSSIENAGVPAIRNTLSRFGDDHLERFNTFVFQPESIGDAGVEKLGIAVRKRNEDAHGNPPDITFRELAESYDVAIKVVDAVRHILET